MKGPRRTLRAGKRHKMDHAVSILRETVSKRQALRPRDGGSRKIILSVSPACGIGVQVPVGRA